MTVALLAFKVAPGVRIRVGGRGVRASVGPRIARVHLGSGRPGVSTGFGPLTLYDSFGSSGGGRRQPRAGSARTVGLTASQAAKLEAAEEILAQLHSIMDLVNEEFTPATPPQARVPEVPPIRAFEKPRVAEAKGATSFFARRERREAIRAAKELAQADREAALAEAAHQAKLEQAELDELWRRLCANDPDLVIQTVNEAFADNEAPAACVGVSDARATIVVVTPDVDDVVPDRMPGATEAGNVSLRKMSKSDRNMFYCSVLYGYALVSTKEAFAVAPGLESVAVIVVSKPGLDVYGERRRPDALVAATIRRSALDGVRWSEHGADAILPQVADELVVNRKGRARDFHPVELDDEPALAAVVGLVDAEA